MKPKPITKSVSTEVALFINNTQHLPKQKGPIKTKNTIYRQKQKTDQKERTNKLLCNKLIINHSQVASTEAITELNIFDHCDRNSIERHHEIALSF